MKLIKLQPSEFVDQIRDGHEMTKLPYPFYVHEDGSVDNQDLWQGDPARVIGFAADLAVQQVDLWWEDAVADPQRAVGMYIVSVSDKGSMGAHVNAVSSVDVIETTRTEF